MASGMTRRGLASAGAAIGGLGLAGLRQIEPVAVQVDFTTPAPKPSLSGFLHGLSPRTPDGLIAGLRPALWRGGGATGQATLSRAMGFGARPVVVVSEAWGYPGHDPNWKSPAAHAAEWQAMVRRVVLETRAAGAPDNTVFDVWNEPYPNQAYFRGSEAEFNETFRLAHDAIREVWPTAWVGGPSGAGFDQPRMMRFMRFCAEAGLRVDVLSWHEFRRPSQLAHMASDLREVRARLGGHPARVREIHINEYLPQDGQYNPGMTGAYLFAMEAGGADGACRACWTAPDGSENCWNGSIDGCLTPGDQKPTAVWSLYRAYAETVVGRVASRSNASLAHFAGRTGDQAVIVLANAPIVTGARSRLGDRMDPEALAPLAAGTPIRLSLHGLGGARITRYDLHDSGALPLTSPLGRPTRAQPAGGGLMVGLSGLRPGSAIVLTLTDLTRT